VVVLQKTNMRATLEVESRTQGDIKSNSMGILILFVLELLIYTRINLWQSAPFIILQPKPVGSLSCHSLVVAVVFPSLMLLLAWRNISFTHLLTPSGSGKGF